ncbi:uncharacterized protein N7498_010059 [Penicillium cinerascens]|uniref:Uncharacterized protein n=1 Tax=Penicillium cinerascens TaxID=70096 RepID=A0A9W9J794_9EURO|nr:uncharacterized protein N7498_010059 [Penicillium cinerascens]KAJ5191074.1 hypothetical protein N7498_010059 [Penicillium cinerascens]
MGIPMWREPIQADNLKTARDKDPSAAARSAIRRQPTIRRPSRHGSSRARGTGVMSSFHSQILDEIQRGVAEPQRGVRSPVLNLGVSEDGVNLDQIRLDALNQRRTRASDNRRPEPLTRSNQITRAADPPFPIRDPDTPPPYRINGDLSPFTPNFAPATGYHQSSSRPTRLPIPRLPNSRHMESRNHDLPSYIPSVLLRDYRNGSGPNRSHRETAIDGLGDRQRSLSPDAERETDAWETLLSTITPDTTLPSTDTSFSSTSASATDPSRNQTSHTSGASWQTQPSRAAHLALDPYPDYLNPCDYSSDDEDTPVNYHRVLGSSSLPLSLRRSPGIHSTMSNHPPIPTISFSFSDSGESDLQQMQAILDRLARREDIPDDWWAGAGLSRTMGRGLSTSAEGNENNRTE